MSRYQESNGSSEEIVESIRQTRDEMDETLEQLGNCLHPRALFDSAIDRIRATDTDEISDVARTVAWGFSRHLQAHPLSSLIFGAAIGLLVYEKTRPAGHKLDTHGLKAEGAAAAARAKAGAWSGANRVRASMHAGVDQVSDAARSSSDRVKEGLARAADEGRDRIRSGREHVEAGRAELKREGRRLKKKVRSHPKAIGMGAAVLAIGLAAGFLLPDKIGKK